MANARGPGGPRYTMLRCGVDARLTGLNDADKVGG